MCKNCCILVQFISCLFFKKSHYLRVSLTEMSHKNNLSLVTFLLDTLSFWNKNRLEMWFFLFYPSEKINSLNFKLFEISLIENRIFWGHVQLTNQSTGLRQHKPLVSTNRNPRFPRVGSVVNRLPPALLVLWKYCGEMSTLVNKY